MSKGLARWATIALVVIVTATPALAADDYWQIADTLQAARASATLRATAIRLRNRADIRDRAALQLFVSGYAALLAYDRPLAQRDLAASFRRLPAAAVAVALAEQAFEIGNPEPAMDWTARGLDAVDGDARAEVELRVIRAQALAWLVRHDEGRAEATRALERARHAGHPRLLGLALRAYAYAIQDDKARALPAFEQAIHESELAGDTRAVGYHLLIMSGPYYPARPFADKIALLDRAVSIARQVRDRQLEGRVLGARGLAWYELARYSAALKDITAADAILRGTGALRSRAVAAGNLGVLYSALGDYERAEQQARLSIALYRRVGNRHGVRNSLDDLSRLALLEGRPQASVALHTRVVELTRELDDNTYLSGAMVRLSLAYQAQRQWAAAERTVREALTLPPTSRQPDLLAEAHVALGHVLRATGQGVEAKRAYDGALAIAAGAATETTLNVRAHHGLALLAAASSRPEDALAHFRAAIAGMERIRADVEDPSWRLTYFADQSALYLDAIDSLATAYQRSGTTTFAREALTIAEHARARTLLESIGGDGQRSRPATVEAIAATLGAGELLVEFVLGETRSFAFALTPDARVGVLRLPSRAEIEKRVEALRNQVSHRPASAADLAAVHRAGAQAYSATIAPLLGNAANVKRLIIVPDGMLWYAPFEAFTLASGEYLADRFEVVRTASGSVLSTIRNRAVRVSAGARLVAFGDPYLPGGRRADSELRMLERNGFSLAPLPGSRREVEAAASAFGPGARSYLGPEFSTEAVLAELQRPNRVVHFATHAILDERVPNRSGIVVSNGVGASTPELLRARDIAALRIPSELIVLSACQTGLGRLVAGEGVLGLVWAFMTAGAPSMVVTLWNVSDAASATMMTAFYREFAAGASKSAALQAARQEMMRSKIPALRHPYYWAGYVLIGEPR